MDEKSIDAGQQGDQPAAATTNRKTNNTTPTVYPDVDFVNRTLP